MALSEGNTMARARSPNYPAIGLKEAVERLRMLYQQEGQAAAAPQVVAKALGFSGLHGTVRTKMAALRKYGLVDDQNGEMKISGLGLQILQPLNEEEHQRSLLEALRKIDLFTEFENKLSSASDDNLKAHLIRRGFTERGALRAVASWRNTLEAAKLGRDHHEDSPDSEDIYASDSPSDHSSQPSDTWRRIFMIPLPHGKRLAVSIAGGEPTVGDLMRAVSIMNGFKEWGIEGDQEAQKHDSVPVATEPEH